MDSKLTDTLEAVELFLSDKEVFNTVLDSVFASIDKDNSGTIEESEIAGFIERVNKQMELNMSSSKDLISEVFKEMDKDHNKNIDKAELGVFLKILLLHQKSKLLAKMKKSEHKK